MAGASWSRATRHPPGLRFLKEVVRLRGCLRESMASPYPRCSPGRRPSHIGYAFIIESFVDAGRIENAHKTSPFRRKRSDGAFYDLIQAARPLTADPIPCRRSGNCEKRAGGSHVRRSTSGSTSRQPRRSFGYIDAIAHAATALVTGNLEAGDPS